MADSNQNDELTEDEAAKRRDDALKRMLDTPPQPHTTKFTASRSRGKSSPKGRGKRGGKS